MQQVLITELMVPISEYATVDEDGTLYDAVAALQAAKVLFDQKRARHRAVLVLDKNGQVIGKIGFFEILQGLEPKYSQLGIADLSCSNFTQDFIRAQLEKYSLWQSPMDDVCRKASKFLVKSFMSVPDEAEFISKEASLDEAVHQLISVRRQSLLVKDGQKVVGVLRLSDVVDQVCSIIEACNID